MLTILEAKAKAVAMALGGGEVWGKDQTRKATEYLAKLHAKGQIGTTDFAQAVSEVSNDSAMRQKLVKHGIIPASTVEDDAFAKAVKAAVKEDAKAFEELVA